MSPFFCLPRLPSFAILDETAKQWLAAVARRTGLMSWNGTPWRQKPELQATKETQESYNRRLSPLFPSRRGPDRSSGMAGTAHPTFCSWPAKLGVLGHTRVGKTWPNDNKEWHLGEERRH